MNEFETKINNSIVFNDRSEYNLKEELKHIDVSDNIIQLFLYLKLC